MRKWLIAALVAAGIGAAGAYAWYSPVLTLKKLQTALQQGDALTLDVLVDWPRVRDSLREDIKALMQQEMKTAKGQSGLEELGNLLGGIFINTAVGQLIDERVTPQGAIGLYKHADMPQLAPAGRYIDSSHYSVVLGDADAGATLTLVLQRDGLGWQVNRARIQVIPLGEIPVEPQPDPKGKIAWRIPTRAGDVTVADQDPDCDYAICLTDAKVGQIKLFEEDHITPVLVVPSVAKPEIIVFSSECAGSSCVDSLSLVDVTKSPPLFLASLGRGEASGIKRTGKSSIAFSSRVWGETVGDELLPVTTKYDRARGLAYVVGKDGPDLGHLLGKVPSAIQASDAWPKLGKLLDYNVKPIADRLAYGSPISLIDRRFLVVSGTQSDRGNENAALIVADLADMSVWVAWMVDGKTVTIRQSRNLGSGPGSPKPIINDWLKQWGKKLRE